MNDARENLQRDDAEFFKRMAERLRRDAEKVLARAQGEAEDLRSRAMKYERAAHDALKGKR